MGLYETLGTCHPKLSRGQVWCTVCARTEAVDSGKCFRDGWPKCCGYTMTIDSPAERDRLTEGKNDGSDV
jgi:hypothetical protein